MPRIDNTATLSPSLGKKTAFKKKNYRPWNFDLLDETINNNQHHHSIDHKSQKNNTKPQHNNTQQSIINDEITEHKPSTNRVQTEHKPDTNRTQTGHKPDTRKKQTEHKPDTQPDTQVDTNRTQTEHKPNTNIHFSALIGLQRKIMLLFYENCKSARTKTTEPVTLEHIAKQLNMLIGSVKTTVRRLQLKGYVIRAESKNGRGGWSRYEISNTLFNNMLQLETEHKLNTNRTQTEHKPDTQPDTQPDTTLSSSSSSSYNINTTTTSDGANELLKKYVLSDEWKNIDIEPLHNIGFTNAHLTQIASQNLLSTTAVQDSINAFAFDLQENKKETSIKKGDPVNFFMGILRNGKPYVPPSNYESPKDKAMRVYLERNREIEQKRATMEKEAFDYAFKNWFSALSDEEKKNLLPQGVRHIVKSGGANMEAHAKDYFKKEIWPNELEKITSSQCDS